MSKLEKNAVKLNIVGPKNRFPRVKLIEPTGHSFVLLGLEIDHRPPLLAWLESGAKKQALAALKAFAPQPEGLVDFAVFKALLVPPGRGIYLKNRPEIAIARYDIVMLLEFKTKPEALAFQQSESWKALRLKVSPLARKTLEIAASNPRMIGPVDHTRDGVFLFNFFYADSLAQNLGIWEYTAGWFVDQTGLDNSCLLAPEPEEGSDYTVINHCRWDHLRQILPSILFKPSFKTYIEANFNANQTAPIPILYQLA